MYSSCSKKSISNQALELKPVSGLPVELSVPCVCACACALVPIVSACYTSKSKGAEEKNLLPRGGRSGKKGSSRLAPGIGDCQIPEPAGTEAVVGGKVNCSLRRGAGIT